MVQVRTKARIAALLTEHDFSAFLALAWKLEFSDEELCADRRPGESVMLNSFVASQQHLGFEDGAFETGRGSNPIFCHQEFLEKIAERDRDSIARRAAFLMQRLSVDSRRLHYKSTRGVNQGWRRSRLGGNRGTRQHNGGHRTQDDRTVQDRSPEGGCQIH